MSQELVSAITNATTDPTTTLERHRAQMAAVDLSQLDAAGRAGPLPVEGGAAIHRPQAVAVVESPPSMSLSALGHQVSDGLQHGFLVKDMGRMVGKLALSQQPNSGVTHGDMTMEFLNFGLKMGVVQTFQKASEKTSETLNTLVVRSG